MIKIFSFSEKKILTRYHIWGNFDSRLEETERQMAKISMDKKVGCFFKGEFKKIGLSVKEVSRRTELSTQKVYAHLRGRKMDTDILMDFSDLIGMNAGDVLKAAKKLRIQ